MNSRDNATKQLFDAISKDDIKSVKTAIFDGADVNGTVQGINGSPLFKAAYKGNLAIIKLLLANKADIHAGVTNATKDIFNGAGVVESAVEGNHPAVVSFLLECGANINQARQDGGTAMLAAANNGDAAIVKILLAKGARIDQFIENQLSVLTTAASNHRVETMKLLVTHILATFKDKPDELLIFLNTNEHFKTAITAAKDYNVSNEVMHLIDALVESCIDYADIRKLLPSTYNFQNTFFKENLLARIQSLPAKQRIALCSKILTEPNHPYRVIFSMQRGRKPCQLGHGVLKQVKITMDAATAKMAEVNQASSWYKGMTPLYYAADKGHIEVARKLIHDGANCNPDKHTDHPLFAAAVHGNIDMINLLVENGATPGATFKTTKQALWKQLQSQPSFIKDALSNFLLRFPSNEVSITPADFAAIFGYADTIDLFNALCDQEPAMAVAIPQASAPVATVAATTEAQPASLQQQEDQELAAAIKASLMTAETAQPATVANSNNDPLPEKPATATIVHESEQRQATPVEIAEAIPAPAAAATAQPISELYKDAYAVLHSDAANFAPAATVVIQQQAPDVQAAAPVPQQAEPAQQNALVVESTPVVAELAPLVDIPAPVTVPSAPISAMATTVNVLDLLYADNCVSTLNAQTLQPAAVQIAEPAPVVLPQPAVGELISLTAAPVAETTAVKSESDAALKLFSIFAETAPAPAPAPAQALAQPVQTAAQQTDNLEWLDELENMKVPTKAPKPVQEEAPEKKKTKQLVWE